MLDCICYSALVLLCQPIVFHEYIYTKSVTIYCCGGIECWPVLLYLVQISFCNTSVYDNTNWCLELRKQGGSSQDTDVVPTPVVIIDQDSDEDATIVEITFGDRLGALLDTVWHVHLQVFKLNTSFRLYWSLDFSTEILPSIDFW